MKKNLAQTASVRIVVESLQMSKVKIHKLVIKTYKYHVLIKCHTCFVNQGKVGYFQANQNQLLKQNKQEKKNDQ